MLDCLIFTVLTALFALSLLYLAGCERLRGTRA